MKVILYKNAYCTLLMGGTLLPALLHGGVVPQQTALVSPILVANGSGATVTALNGAGHVVGYVFNETGHQRAFFWDGTNSTLLGTLGGSVSSCLGLNNLDQTTGYATTVGDAQYRAFLGIGQSLFDLGTLGGGESVGYAINDAGTVTGYSFLSFTTTDFHAFSSRSGIMRSLGTLGGSMSVGYKVNQLDQIIGDSSTALDAETHAFLYGNGVMTDLGTLGGTFSSAIDLNNLGHVAGYSTLAGDLELRAFLFHNGALQDLGTLGGSYSAANAVSDENIVVGESWLAGDLHVHAFAWQAGLMKDLGHLGGHYSSAWAINSTGTIVGASTNSAGQRRAVVWQNGTLLDLNSLLPGNSGWSLSDARFINNQGHIVGNGVYLGSPAWYRLEIQAAVNQPPTAHAGEDQVVECGNSFVLNGTKSSDPEGNALAYEWIYQNSVISTSPTAEVTLPVGSYRFLLRVTDLAGLTGEDEVLVTVRDSVAPTITSCTATPHELHPANRQMVPVNVSVVASDRCDGTTACRIVRVESSEAVTGPGDKTSPDWVITGPLSLEVRSEVTSPVSRIYTVIVACVDSAGNESLGNAYISVSRSKGPDATSSPTSTGKGK